MKEWLLNIKCKGATRSSRDLYWAIIAVFEWRNWEQWRTEEFFFFGRGVQQIQLRTEDRENGDLVA